MVAASRVTYAYGRDSVFPFSYSRFGPARVNSRTKTPVNAVVLNTIVGILLNLLIFAGPLAIGSIFSIGAIGAYVAFTVPVTLRTFVVGNRFKPGPWNLGRYSKASGIVATAFTVLMAPILCFPTVKGKDLNAQSMNWTVVVYGGPMALAMIWWFAGARKWFKGPKVRRRLVWNAEYGEPFSTIFSPQVNVEHRILRKSYPSHEESSDEPEKS